MKYIFDTSIFILLFNNFYRSRFPDLWQLFDDMIAEGEISSTREVFREIEDQGDELFSWANSNKNLFVTPDATEAAFVSEIFKVPHFRDLIEQKGSNLIKCCPW